MAHTILVVDDDTDIRDSIRLVLDREGYRSLGAANGAEALGVLQTTPEVDLILLDMMMPVMDGIEFHKAQAALAPIAGIPVVVVSGGGHVR